MCELDYFYDMNVEKMLEKRKNVYTDMFIKMDGRMSGRLAAEVRVRQKLCSRSLYEVCI